MLTAPNNVLAGVTAEGTGNTATSAAPANAVPLGTFATASPTTEALSINHQGQFPSVTVSFNLAPNASLGTAIEDINKVTKQSEFPGFRAGGISREPQRRLKIRCPMKRC